MNKRHYEILALIVAKAIVDLEGCAQLLWHFTKELKAQNDRFDVARFEIAVTEHVVKIREGRPA